jgi:hypothetical protein
MTSSANAANRNRPGNERHPLDFYRTPEWCTAGLYTTTVCPWPTLDPCAGDGAMRDALRALGRTSPERATNYERGGEIIRCAGPLHDSVIAQGGYFLSVEQSAEIQGDMKGFDDCDAVLCLDSLKESWADADVVMNPPYKDAMTFLEKAVTEARSFTALVRIGLLASKKRREFWVRNKAGLFATSYLSSRPSFVGGPTDSADYVWVCWASPQLREQLPPFQINWIEKPEKAR